MAGGADWDVVSYVFSSDVRARVLEILRAQKATPSQIAKRLSQPISHISRALHELQAKKLVILLTPSRTKARLYEVTAQGREVSDKVAVLKGGKGS